jgi:hypothetical protein
MPQLGEVYALFAYVVFNFNTTVWLSQANIQPQDVIPMEAITVQLTTHSDLICVKKRKTNLQDIVLSFLWRLATSPSCRKKNIFLFSSKPSSWKSTQNGAE